MGHMRIVYEKFVKPFRWPILVMLCFIVIQRVLSMAVTGLSGWMVNFLIQGVPFSLWVWVPISMALIWIASHAFGSYSALYNQRNVDQPLWRHLMNAVMKHLSGLSMGQATMEHSIITTSVIAEGRAAVQGIVHDLLEDAVPIFFQIVMVAIGFVLFLHPILAVEMVTTVVLFIGGTTAFNIPMPKRMKHAQKESRKDSKFRNEILRHMSFVVGNGRQHQAVLECDASMAYIQEIDRDLWTPYIFKLTVRDSALAIARAGIIATAGYLAYQGKMGVGSMVVVWSWLNMATGDLYMTGGLYRRMITHIAAIDRFLKMFDVTTDTPESDNPCIPESPKGAIAVHDVSFSYPSKPSPEEADTIETEQEEQEPEDHTIQGINLRIAAGQRVAIVGKSGSGKSTIARLLARAFDPHRGSVESDGAGLPQTSLQWLRENIGVVDQRVGIFDQTLRYNLLCALSDRQRSEVTEARIKQVMRDCAVDEFLGDLPMGLDTVLGESGNRLSGGQAQRVALARIMLKDPLILILDEATSSLDAETEEYIRANLDRARQGRTTIIIAHRFSTIRKAESVIVVDDGKIVDTGTHRELWSRCPAYQRLVQNQILALHDLVA